MVALAGLLEGERLLGQEAPANPLAPKAGHFPAKAKSVIWLFMNGGPSQVDTWDHKPELARRDGVDLAGFDRDTGFFRDQVGPIMKSPYRFARHGQSAPGLGSLSHMAQHVDKMAFVYSCWTDSNNHSPALMKINTGMTRMGFPCVGSWVTYGLGTASQSLPAFVVMYDTLGRGLPKGYSQNWGAGFLPSIYQGTALKPQGAPIDNLYRPADLTDRQQRNQLDLLHRLSRDRAEQPRRRQANWRPALEIGSSWLTVMQMSALEELDYHREPLQTQRLYGIDNPRCGHFGKQCLMARRLVELRQRVSVQIYYLGMSENERSWDGHMNIQSNHSGFAGETDLPIAGLLTDLDQRGLLEETLVVWGGEFGRLPLVQRGGTGRDHNPHAFTVWLAGAGIKGGTQYGATDEIGHRAADSRVSVHDLHATILHLLGIDHERLTYRYSGRDFRLTDVSGEVVQGILA